MTKTIEEELWDKLDPEREQIVSFYPHPIFERIEAGVKIYKIEHHVRKHVKDSNDSVSGAITGKDKAEHAVEYARYMNMIELDLTSLNVLCNKAVQRTLNEMGIYSLDALAKSDRLPVYNELCNQAKLILEIKHGTNQDRSEQHNDSDNERAQINTENTLRKVQQTRCGSRVAKRDGAGQAGQEQHYNQVDTSQGSGQNASQGSGQVSFFGLHSLNFNTKIL